MSARDYYKYFLKKLQKCVSKELQNLDNKTILANY